MVKKILVCGAGSIGVYLGTLLYSKGNEVTLFGRRKLKKVEGSEIFINGKKFKVPEKIFKLPKNGKYDLIFITTKLYDFDYIINAIKKSRIKSGIISSVQNGLLDTSKYSKILGKRIIPITVFAGFNLKNNRIDVNTTSVGWKTELSANGREISRILLNAGIPCTADRKFDSLRAEKTIVNSCLNALSAIENKTFKELFSNKKTSERISLLFDECYNILKKEHKLDNKIQMKKALFKNWSKLNHYSSTCQDLHSGRPTEARFFNGYILKIGEKHKLPAENNKKILKEIKEVEKKR